MYVLHARPSLYFVTQYSARLPAARRGVRPTAARRGVRRPLVARNNLALVYCILLLYIDINIDRALKPYCIIPVLCASVFTKLYRYVPPYARSRYPLYRIPVPVGPRCHGHAYSILCQWHLFKVNPWEPKCPGEWN
jgi:hypothetical protein